MDQGLDGQGQVITEQQHLRCPPCLQVGFHDDGDIEQFREVPVPGLHLVDAGSDVLFNRLQFQVRLRQGFQRQPPAVFAPPALARILASIGEVQLGVMAQLGDEVQPRLCNRLQAGVVPQCAVVHEIDEAQIHPNQFQHGADAALQLCLERG